MLTADEDSLMAALVEGAIKLDDPDQFVIEGLEDLDGFEVVDNPRLGTMDQPKVQAGLIARVRRIIDSTPVRAILSECTELPAFSDALRTATSLPVFDVVTCLNFFHSARQPSFFATVAEQRRQGERAVEEAAAVAAVPLPPTRNATNTLRDDARELTRTQLELGLGAVTYLQRELLIDPLEAEARRYSCCRYSRYSCHYS